MQLTQNKTVDKPTATITGAEALLRQLTHCGVDTVFGYPGGAILPVYDALYSYSPLRHILVRHEQGAMHAAQGYARASGRVGVVIVTSGPGAANCITGLCDAMMDSTPLVLITGQVGARFLGSDAFQETDVIALAQPVTKWARQVRCAEEVPEAIATAMHIASTGRPGPVVIDIAKDAQVGKLNFHPARPAVHRGYSAKVDINLDDVDTAAAMINSAQRPLIISGGGVAISGAESELARLAEKADIPVGCTLQGLSTIPSDHPLFVGMAGMHGAVAVNIATNQADLIIGIGMRFDDRVTGRVSTYAPHAQIIHIDIDAAEFSKTVQATLPVHGDAKQVLSRLLPMIRQTKRPQWRKLFAHCAEVEDAEVMERELRRQGDEPMTMGEVADAVSRAAHCRAIAVADVGQNQMMTARYFRHSRPRSFISSGGLGTMGFGLPAAIGAAIACPDRTVCYFGGDGGMQMTIQELGTIMQYRVPVKMILLNNNFLGNVRQWQQLFFGGRFSQTPMLNPDFGAIAAAYGIECIEVAHRSELHAAIDRMLAIDGPVLLNVAIDPTDMVFPMTPAGADVDHIMLNPDKLFKL